MAFSSHQLLRVSIFSGLWLGLGLVMSTCAAVGLTLFHTPVTTWRTQEPLLIQANVLSDVAINEVNLYYRPRNLDEFRKIEMLNQAGNTYQAMIPLLDQSKEGIEYYIEATDKAYARRTFPEFMAPISPQFVPVSDEKDQTAIELVLPENLTAIQDPQPLFMVGYNQNSPIKVDTRSLVFYLDNRDITALTNIAPFIATVRPDTPLKEGLHVFKITERTVMGEETRLLATFQIGGEKPIPVQGNAAIVHTGSKLFDTMNNTELDLDLETELVNAVKARAQVSLTSREAPKKQPESRYYAKFNTLDRQFNLTLGDTTPLYSNFTVNGIMSRGFEFLYQNDNWELTYSRGETMRAIDGITSSSNVPGVFRQNLTGLHLGYNFGLCNVGFNLAQISDDERSIFDVGGTKAQENTLGSLTTKWLLNEGKTSIETEIAGSLFYNDKQASENAAAKKLIPGFLASMFRPLDGTQVNAAARIQFQTPLFFNNLRGYLTWAGMDYRSLGAGSIRPNEMEAFLENKMLMGTPYMFVVGSGKYTLGNVMKNAEITPTQISARGNWAMLFPELPSLMVNGQMDIKKDKNKAGASTADYTSLMINANVGNLGLDLFGILNSWQVSVGYGKTTDKLAASSPSSNMNSNNLSFSGNWRISFLQNWTIELNPGFNQNADALRISKTSTSLAAKISTKYPNLNLKPYIRYTLTMTQKSDETERTEKTIPEIGLVFEPMDKHQFETRLLVTFYRDRINAGSSYADTQLDFTYRIKL